MGILAVLRDEFQTKKLGFTGITSYRMCISQWRLPVGVYLTYRLVIALYAAGSLVYIVTYPALSFPLPLPVYLTSWAYFALTLYLLAHFAVAACFHYLAPWRGDDPRLLYRTSCCGCPSVAEHALSFVEAETGSSNGANNSSRRSSTSTNSGVGVGVVSADGTVTYQSIPDSINAAFVQQAMLSSLTQDRRPEWYLCVVWVLFDIVSVLALTVTFAYFVFLFHAGGDSGSNGSLSFSGLQAHVFNSVLVLVEHLITGVPYRLLHIVYPLLYIVVYMVFSILYWAGDHRRVIYPKFLDWNHPGPTLGYVLLTGFVILPLVHVFFFLIYRVKKALYERC